MESKPNIGGAGWSFKTWVPWVLITVGIILRLAQFLANRSLWLDEAFLALNIGDRSFSGLFLPLDNHQGAPVGFLLIEKLAIEFFGNNEYSLRLFPLLSGIASLFLLYGLAKEFVSDESIPIALGLFAVLDPLIYYSSEVKQYSVDVAVVSAIFLLTARVWRTSLSIRLLVLYGIFGGIAIWFSHPAVFALAGCGLSLAANSIGKADRKKLAGLFGVSLVWLFSFTFLYYLNLQNLSKDKVLQHVWEKSFMPSPLQPLEVLRWLKNQFFNIFKFPGGLSFIGVGAFSFIIGTVSLFKKEGKVLVAPALTILFVLFASALGKYPFVNRFLLFLVPLIVLVIAEGARTLLVGSGKNLRYAGIFFIVLLFMNPVLDAKSKFFTPREREEIKPILEYYTGQRRKGDYLYVYCWAKPALDYYSRKYGIGDYILGITSHDAPNRYLDDLDRLRGKGRVWILFSHIYADSGLNEEYFMVLHLDRTGTRLDSRIGKGASLYLYDL